MRLRHRDKHPFWYSLFISQTPIIDEWGNETTEYKQTYSQPKLSFGNLSPSKGDTEADAFGSNIDYTNILLTETGKVPLVEGSRIWIDKKPTESHDYIVVAIAASPNFTKYALQKVEVRHV